MKKRWITLLLIPMSLVLMAGSCDNSRPKNSNAQRSQAVTEQYQKQLEAAVPYPLDAMRDSIERRNLKERLLRFNKPDKIGYIYLLSDVGTVITFYTIKGKISSTQSQLTASDVAECHHDACGSPVVREAPGDDGSYGPNEDGVFFFTTEGAMIQWNGKFMYSDVPLKVESKPVLIADQNAKPAG